MDSRLRAARWGLWSSVVILVSGTGLVLGIVASALFLPAALTTGWAGMSAYAEAYRANGGTITAFSFLAALVSCPAYMIQVVSVHRLHPGASRIRSGLGLVFGAAFAALAGFNYVVQLTVVRMGILSGQALDLGDLVFQNPNSLMIRVDFAGWFCLGLAFLTVVPYFRAGRLNRAIRYVLILDAVMGCLLLASLAFTIPAIGQLLLAMISATLLCADILFLVFFRRVGRVRLADGVGPLH